ncbi:DgyrCDS1458 [Dimorphilus gyrociliatus]|uniref:DgyrCDS1458 n=1 Tax=Dimorphilus gyrociliatus TaxID=2664684 RepID=A0A7I8V7H0_9ANNE|nr:DgyrCDS1458 [Dimorphilus gyrociliatus]
MNNVINGDSHFEVVDFSLPQERNVAKIHPVSEPNVCSNCLQEQSQQFNPDCHLCFQLLLEPSTSISEIFAILRQWNSESQSRILLLTEEILKRGAHINDRDGLTDMTLLHYASRSGAEGVGNVETSCQTVQLVLERGADVYIRCRWTNMAAIHYAAFFDVAPVLQLLLKASDSIDIDAPCSIYENGGPLHIAAINLSIECARLLIAMGADCTLKDDLGRIPFNCIPETTSEDLKEKAERLRLLLREAIAQMNDRIPSKVTLQSLGLKIGDKVIVGGVKSGTLRFCGTTQFAQGIWAGIELDEPVGKNDGSIGGVTYFHCSKEYGIFAPISKITKYNDEARTNSACSNRKSSCSSNVQSSKLDVSHVTAKVDTGLRVARSYPPTDCYKVGERVIVAGKKSGTLRFSGTTEFASGWWYGIELDHPLGRNDGSVNGKAYFVCKPNFGVFAPSSKVKRIEQITTLKEQNTDLGSANNSSQNMNRGSTIKARPSSFKSRNPFDTSAGEMKVQEGMTVLCNNELATVRFIGDVHFEDGLWLGVEMRKLSGRNDGSIQGRRYFTCKSGHGLLVRPNKVTVRGINAANLPPFNEQSNSNK